MKRILYFSGHNMTAFHWQGNSFAGRYTFTPTEEGLQEFDKYLGTIETGSVKILADVIEEDFIKEKIPHVGKNDQRAIVRRYINRHYRKSTDYYTYKITGRDKEGRKDDVILYSVITNPGIMASWIDVIHNNNAPLDGIWSLPLISESIVRKITNSLGNILLVSQQVPSNIRQSFFVNGKFEISRNAVINPEESSLGEYINEEVEQTSRFLANQRHIGFDDVINIHIICDRSDVENIRQHCEDTPLKIYHYHAIDEVKNKFDCGNIPGQYAGGLFAHECKSRWFFSGHYGPKDLFKHYYQKLFKNSLMALNVVVILIALMVILNNFVNTQVVLAETEVLNHQKDEINRKYERDFFAHEAELKQAVAMQSSVLFYERVDSLRNISPQNFMNRFSAYLQRSGVEDIAITEVSWTSSQEHKQSKNQKTKNTLQFSSNQEVRHSAKIKGLIGSEGERFEQAVKKVNAILAELTRRDDIEKLDIIKMPFDVRSESNLSNSHKSINTAKSINSSHRSFEFHILMKAAGNV